MSEGRTRGRFSLTLLTVMALGLIGLTACTDDPAAPNPSSTSAPSVSTGPTPTSTATPPAAPKARPTPKSAEAFVKYFWEVHNYAYTTLDTDLLKSVSEPDCKFCRATVRDLEALKKSDSIAKGSLVHPLVVAAPPIKISQRILVSTVISQEAGSEIRKDGTVKTFPGRSKIPSAVGLSWFDDHWLVHDVSIDKQNSSP
jgi:hypothetical protein